MIRALTDRPAMRQSARRVLIVGTGVLARTTADDLRDRKDVSLLGAVLLPGETPHRALNIPVVTTHDALGTWLEQTYVDEVYLAADLVQQRDTLQATIVLCERLGVPFAVPAHGFRMQRALPALPGVATDGFLHYEPFTPAPRARAVKRALDMIGAGLGLAMLSPLLALVAAAIKLDSRGPVLFTQTRVGRHGRPFQILKFRSMVIDAEARKAALESRNEHTEGPVFKITHDPRITRLGRFIRRTSIDELPQLWNVFVGEMSLVGPRPPIPAEVQKYDRWQRRRLSVPPGLTGLWQVSGRNSIGFDQWMRLDLQYIDNWSLRLDFSLLSRTIPVVLTGRGAS
jgi:exopolysaccharide biosynthesis polyprenyl glycosylphosphotransferase